MPGLIRQLRKLDIRLLRPSFAHLYFLKLATTVLALCVYLPAVLILIVPLALGAMGFLPSI